MRSHSQHRSSSPHHKEMEPILYRAKNQHSDHKAETVEDTAQYIKENIFKARKKDDYNESIFKYLLTPEQVETMRKKKKGEDKTMEKTRLVIENLVHYNTIVGTLGPRLLLGQGQR